MTPGRFQPGNATPTSRRPVARMAASKPQNQLSLPSVRPAARRPTQATPGRGATRLQTATPSRTSTPASKASPRAGSLARIASVIELRFRTAPVIRPPKWKGTSSPIEAGSRGCSSTSMTLSPSRAASSAAAHPAGPAPTTSSWTRSRGVSRLSLVETGSNPRLKASFLFRRSSRRPPSLRDPKQESRPNPQPTF